MDQARRYNEFNQFECIEFTGIAYFGDDDKFGIGTRDRSGHTLVLRIGRDVAQDLANALPKALEKNEVYLPENH
jgi:hypothetical protein